LTLVLILAVLAVYLSFDANRRTLLRVNRFASQGMWPEVLREARAIRGTWYAHEISHAVTRALYETGRLPYEMFSFPQHRQGFMLGWGMKPRWVRRTVRHVAPLSVGRTDVVEEADKDLHNMRMRSFSQLGDLNLQLGLVNEAEHEAHEALELLGNCPQILKRLALINVVKGQTEAAKLFLRALTLDLRGGAWARDALRRLHDDPLWSADPQVGRIRAVMVTRGSAVLSPFLEDRLDELLRGSKSNRMAFEFKMALHLLNWQLDRLVAELERLDDFDYPDVPKHYEEAVVIHESISGLRANLRGRRISPQTRRTYREFCERAAPFFKSADSQGAQEALAERFGGTYFFYYFLGESRGAGG